MKRLLNGHILVQFDTALFEKTDSGLILNPDYDREFHQGVTGTVAQVCEEKQMARDWNPRIDIDCQIGDRVVMHYVGCQTALECGLNNNQNGTWFMKDDKLFAVISYAFVMAFKRNGVLKAAPGYALARRVKKPATLGSSWILAPAEDSEEIQFQLVSMGSDMISLKDTYMPPDIPEGSIVMTDHACAYELEGETHMRVLEEPLVCFDKYLIYGLVA